MADDPNRDILPVKDGSCADTGRSSIDPRERHIVGKLDRCELEDKYLRLLEEAHNLKKLANRQEDKIKRLATKLMRVTANPKSCSASLDVYDNKNKIVALEIENAKLKDKILVLRNQLLSHTISGRSSSRSRTQVRPSSGRITCRSENSRTKITCSCVENGNNETANGKNSLDKIEELEMEKDEMANRIAELEKELSAAVVVSQREKISENIKYIQVWRQMKQLNDKLIDAEQENDSLNEQINDLKRLLEEATKNNETIAIDLVAERKRSAELDEEIMKARGSDLSLREKEEQIKDLVNEVKILQEHNHELIELSTKYGEVELENIQLKKKLVERHHEEDNLRSTFTDEQANIVALQASNEQLLGKLQELQKNIDSLTVQLTSFPTQTDKEETSRETQITMKSEMKTLMTREPYKDGSSQVEESSKVCPAIEKIVQRDVAERVEQCKKCCEVAVPLEDVIHAGRKCVKLVDNSAQTDFEPHLMEKKEQEIMTSEPVMTPMKEIPEKQEPQLVKKPANYAMMMDGSTLTPDKMLKLLDQAQIAAHVDAQRFPQKPMAPGVDYNEFLDQHGRHSGAETFIHATQGILHFQPKPQPQDNARTAGIPQTLDQPDSTKLLSLFYNILHEYNQSTTSSHEIPTLYRPSPTIKQQYAKDVNNNVETTRVATSPPRIGCSTRKYCSVPYNKFRHDKSKRKTSSVIRKHDQIPIQNGIGDCTCSSSMRCPPDSACRTHCCVSPKSNRYYSTSSTEMHHVPQVGNKIAKNASIDNTLVHGMYSASKLSGRSMSECGGCENPENVVNVVANSEDETLHEYVKRLDKCREIMHGVAHISAEDPLDRMNIPNQLRCQAGLKEPRMVPQQIESFCSLECPNDCADMTSPAPDSSPLVITDGQGLVELHIMSLQLSTCAKEILFREKDLSDVLLFVSWDIWNQETAYTPTLKCPKLNFNSSFVYRISDLFSFFNYVLSDLVIFEVNVFHEDRDNYVVARGKLSVKDILDYPQNKLHYIAPVNSVIPCSIGMSFGQLSLWVRLSCDVEKVVQFKKQRGIYTQISEDIVRPRRVTTSQRVLILPKPEIIDKDEKNSEPEEKIVHDSSSRELSPQATQLAMPTSAYKDESSETSGGDIQLTKTRSMIQIDRNSLTVVKESEDEIEKMFPDTRDVRTISGITDNKTLYTTATPWEETTTTDDTNERNGLNNYVKPEEKDEGKPMPQPTKSSLIEFSESMARVKNGTNSSRSIDSFHEVTSVIADKNWEKYKDRSQHFVGAQENQEQFAVENSVEKDTIIIEIVHMILFPKSFIMQNPDLQLLYIEYCFLGYCGADMETVSLKKPETLNQKMTFNFKRKFRVDDERHSLQNNILRAMLDESTNPNIRFIVVCEPLPEDTDTKECVEVGYAHFNIREYALGDSEKTVSLPIYNVSDESDKIGLLTIAVLGLDTIRQRLGRRESDLN